MLAAPHVLFIKSVRGINALQLEVATHTPCVSVYYCLFRYQNKRSQILAWIGNFQLIWWPSEALFFTVRLHFHVITKRNGLADFCPALNARWLLWIETLKRVPILFLFFPCRFLRFFLVPVWLFSPDDYYLCHAWRLTNAEYSYEVIQAQYWSSPNTPMDVYWLSRTATRLVVTKRHVRSSTFERHAYTEV